MDRRWKLFAISGVIAAGLDQATKIYARSALPSFPNGFGKPVSVIENFWDWQLSYNTGSAFSMFSGARVFLTVVGLVALGAIVWMLRKTKPEHTRLCLSLGMVAGGAVGNLIDRIAFGKVTDFIVWRYYEHRWPTFNIADVALVIGVGFLFLDMKKLDDDDSKDGEAKSKKGASKSAKARSGKKKKSAKAGET